ncbi:cilia- and flagella-associated protein 221-like isoform X2 [Convolutriloba macropyga]|uniref:cilia- and flagella-associated protein 221-like isoform X2 n=1 Tax=Convolutriloba macropyga TaxID=536237 RepID=UPI003F526D90
MATVDNRLPEDFSRIAVPAKLVAPIPTGAPPNALTERKFFSKLGQSYVVKAEPKSVHFAGFNVGETIVKELRLTNVSAKVQRWHIIPPSTPHFKVSFQKPERCVPGLFMDMKVIFTPDEWRYYSDSVRIHCQNEENITIPLHAYPVMSGTEPLPESLILPVTPIGETTEYKIPLTCTAPIDFEFHIKVVSPHEAFSVTPLEGLVPANGTTEVSITFAPKEFSTALMRLELLISQFGFSPLFCTLVGHAVPGHLRYLVESKFLANQAQVEEEEELPMNYEMSDRLMDLESSRAVSRMPRKKKHFKDSKNQDANLLSKSLEVEFSGHRFPLNLNNVHAVNYVLTQQQGKLKIKDLKHALEQMRKRGRGTKQMKEAVFESAVRQVVLEERANNLRWQNQLGSQPMTQKAKNIVLEDRKQSLVIYHNETRLEPIPEEEYEREKTKLLTRRTYRLATDVPPEQALFDHYKTNLFAKRHFAKERFKMVVRKAMIQYRCNKRVVRTRQLITDYRAGLVGKIKQVSYFDQLGGEEELGQCPLKMEAKAVEKFQFPVYEKPGHKDDMAPDAIGRVPVKSTQVSFRRKTPVFELCVGKQYEMMGYSQFSIYEHRSGYVRPGLPRPLRTDAQDEIVKVPLPLEVIQSGGMSIQDTTTTILARESITGGGETTLASTIGGGTLPSAGNEEIVPVNSCVVETRSLTTLQPPPLLTKSPQYHPLHIFNPMPGLMTFYHPIAYSEVDGDFHLCPVPRYTLPCSKDAPDATSVHITNPHMSTQKKYVDEEDVIRGVMTWKKYPSQSLISLASTTTLANIYAPRLSDPFCNDVIPKEGPQILAGLPEEDQQLVSDEKDTQNVLTPTSILDQFHIPPEFTEKDGSILSGSKLPATHNNLTTRGQPSRYIREVELEKFMEQSGGGVRLGTKIDEKIDKYRTLCSNSELILK